MYDVLEFSHKEISEILNITEKNYQGKAASRPKKFKKDPGRKMHV
jgi:DNA-directed RNA polymerase specialized sigma24 family protein